MQDDNFLKWLDQWDAAQKELDAEKKETKSPLRTSFFNGLPSSLDYEQTEEGSPEDWTGIYARSMEMQDDDGLLTDSVAYAGEVGMGRETNPDTPEKGGKKKMHTSNPIHFASAGPDAADDDNKLRVTKNWSNGEDLNKLDGIKRELEQMERKFHDADVLNKGNKNQIQKKLDELRNRVHKLSQDIVSDPQKDLT